MSHRTPVLSIVTCAAVLLVCACTFEWDDFDPRVAAGGATSVGGMGSGGTVVASGGNSSAGGAASGGDATGGSATGGSAAGGSSSVGGSTGDWYDDAWSHRVAVTASAPAVDLDDFTILVALDDTRFDYPAAQPDGADLRFVSDGMLIPHHIESWSPDGTSFVWVRLPTLAADGSSTLHLYFGNPDAPSTANSSQTYDDDFAAVWHLTGLADATASGHAASESSVSRAPGQIADGRRFDGMAGYVEIAADADIDDVFNGGGTVEAWFRAASAGENGFGRIANKATSTTSAGGGWSLELNAPNQSISFQRGFSGGGATWIGPGGAITLDSWTYVALVYDDSDAANRPSIYINGVSIAVGDLGGNSTGTADSSSGVPLRIGNFAISENRTFDGVLDEVRISTTARSAAWIEAQHESMTDNLLSFGSVESL